MASTITAPNPQQLLPPLLACLPVSFASSRPPPALLPLLSPILRQRLHIFTTTSTSAHDNWIRLLCWDSSKSETLKETIENANFEPHPVSGEVEIGDIPAITYKKFDSETLKAQIPLTDWSLTAIYLWCTGSDEGNNWQLAELMPYDSDLEREASWSSTIADAEDKGRLLVATQVETQAKSSGGRLSVPGQEDDDDDYWAQYDNTPGRGTPARKASVNPGGSSTNEADYYARYADVQPAMDNYDPDEKHEGLGESTLGGDNIQQMLSRQGQHGTNDAPQEPHPHERNRLSIPEDDDVIHVNHPVPSSPSSRGSDIVAKLEDTAERYSASEIAIKQHISTSVKSMFRLAKGAGITRQEFEDMVQRELETLSMLDRDD